MEADIFRAAESPKHLFPLKFNFYSFCFYAAIESTYSSLFTNVYLILFNSFRAIRMIALLPGIRLHSW